ncbi:unnamed protein product [Debaryomyces tyrocola]|nr:unnamed protein product [Debaryomyces tyrocola]
MFILIRRKYIQLVVVITLLLTVIASLLSVLNETSRVKINSKLRLNYLDRLTSQIYSGYFEGKDKGDTFDPESRFNKKIDAIYKEKKNQEDDESSLWIMDTTTKGSSLKVPPYYYDMSDKPPILPFDIRFTLGMYYHHIRSQSKKNPKKIVSAPFHWYDWVDLSILNQYLLAPAKEKPTCALLDARMDEIKVFQEKDKKQKEKDSKLKEFEQNQINKEEDKKKIEETQKKIEENKIEDNIEKPDGKNDEKKENKEDNSIDGKKEEKELNDDKNKKEKRHVKRGESVDPKEYCVDDFHLPSDFQDGNAVRPGFNVFKSDMRTTPDKAILLGKSYLYTYAPTPSMIVFLTKDGSYNITVKGREKLLNSDLVGSYVNQEKTKAIDPLTEFNKLKKKVKVNSHQSINDYEINLTEDSFILKHKELISEYESKLKENGIAVNEYRYLESLKYSDSEVNPPKYFAEARLIGSLVGDHYDWRFFNGVMYEASQRSLILHRLVRSWLSFSRKNGINTWVAHGSLLSWYWNGFSFPWDYDIDVQVPVMDLHKLSLQFNQTLVVEDMEEGYGRYFLDCGSFITLRAKGNGNNNIDARFIDIDTGIYIDITGLAVSNTKSPGRYKEFYPDQWVENAEDYTEANTAMKAYNCRNNHFSTLDELSPLVKTFVEGEMAYVPRRYSDILSVEYPKGLLSKQYSGHVFIPQLRLWVKEGDLYYFLHDKEKWKLHNYNEEYTNIESQEDLDKENARFELTETQKAKLLQEAAARKKLGQTQDKSTKLSDKDLRTISNFKPEQLLELLSKEELFINYCLTRDFTFFHQEEIMRLLFGKSTDKLLKSQKAFKPFTTNLLDYYIHNNDYNYDHQVDKYIALQAAYSS